MDHLWLASVGNHIWHLSEAPSEYKLWEGEIPLLDMVLYNYMESKLIAGQPSKLEMSIWRNTRFYILKLKRHKLWQLILSEYSRFYLYRLFCVIDKSFYSIGKDSLIFHVISLTQVRCCPVNIRLN